MILLIVLEYNHVNSINPNPNPTLLHLKEVNLNFLHKKFMKPEPLQMSKYMLNG